MTAPNLTAERLFAEPPLFRPPPSALQFAPDGSYLAMLRPAADDHERMDLWRYDIGTRKLDRWVDARDLGATGPLSDAEKAERERRRQFSHGVSRFAISADGCWVLIGAGGAGLGSDQSSL